MRQTARGPATRSSRVSTAVSATARLLPGPCGAKESAARAKREGRGRLAVYEAMAELGAPARDRDVARRAAVRVNEHDRREAGRRERHALVNPGVALR